MTKRNNSWAPFRPNAKDLETITRYVSEIKSIQDNLVANHPDLHIRDRVAHQYQVVGALVKFKMTDDLPSDLLGIGLFEPGAEHFGVGRVSTGLGSPHIETNPDFLGLMLAFQTKDGCRVDFLGINSQSAPTKNHKEFMDVLHATGESAGAEFSLISDWGGL